MSARHNVLDLSLHEKQSIAFESEATELLYGGAAGGGKSHLMRVAAITWCAAIPGLQVYLFRRIRDDLVKNHMEGPKGFRSMLAGWVMCGFVKIVDDEIRFWNGSRIYLCHCKDEKDIYKYQGAEIHVLLADELTHFTEAMYRFLRNRVRMVGIGVPAGMAGKFPRILASANPGNIGHLWVKATFVDPGSYEVRRAEASEGGMLRQFIPALLEDNPSMAQDDPGYETRLQGLGSASLVQAMRYGNWDVIEGAFFDCWEPRRHIVRPFEVPKLWLRFMSGDWGSAKPFSFGWWAVASDPMTVEARDGGQRIVLPRGCLVRTREWYGAKKPNEGLKLHADAVARGIKQREEKDAVKPSYRVLDPSAFAEDGGESIAQAMAREKLSFRPADNARVVGRGAMGGWDQMRGRLVGDEDGNPMLVTFATCHDSIRTIPALQHDDARPEDVDTDGEDHCFAAGTLVETAEGPVSIEQLIGTAGEVVTAGATLTSYRSVRRTRRKAELVLLTFDNGRIVRCTPDHKFLVGTDEWRYASELTGRNVLCSQPLSARRSRSSTASATTFAAGIFRTKAGGCIWPSGNTIRRMFRPGSTSITSAMTDLITGSRIWNACLGPITLEFVMARQPEQEHSPRSLPPVQPPRSGTALKRACAGTASISRGTFVPSLTSGLLLSVWSAGCRIKSALFGSNRENIAGKTAVHVLCVSVERLSEKADVYCLTVPETGCFAIEGGILVSNCGDEWRYACMSRPWVRKAALVKAVPKDGYRRAEAQGESWRV